MKKKLRLSVADVVNRTNSPKGVPQISTKSHLPTCFTPQSNFMRFEDMYKQAIEQGNKYLSLKESKAEKKMASVYSNRPKRESFTKTAYTLNSNVSSLANSRKKTATSIEAEQVDYDCNKENLQENLKRNEKTEKKVKNDKIETTLERFRKCEESLNHNDHSHFRENNECFLSEREVDSLMCQMGYNIRHSKYVEFLNLLEVDEYGGAPLENLYKVIECIEKTNEGFEGLIKSLPEMKMIDNNLKVSIPDKVGEIMRNYFSDFRETNPLFSHKQELIEESSKQLFSNKSSSKYTSFVSPNEKHTNKTSPEKLSVIIGSEKSNKNEKEQIKVNEFNHNIEDEYYANTFREFEYPNAEFEYEENTFSKQLSQNSSIKSEKDLEDNELKIKHNVVPEKEFEDKNFPKENLSQKPCLNQNPYKNVNKPILSIDVNIGEGLSEKIIVYEGESAKEVSERLAEKFSITEETKMKFYKLLESHLNTFLWKIDELSEEMMTDRDIE